MAQKEHGVVESWGAGGVLPFIAAHWFQPAQDWVGKNTGAWKENRIEEREKGSVWAGESRGRGTVEDDIKEERGGMKSKCSFILKKTATWTETSYCPHLGLGCHGLAGSCPRLRLGCHGLIPAISSCNHTAAESQDTAFWPKTGTLTTNAMTTNKTFQKQDKYYRLNTECSTLSRNKMPMQSGDIKWIN